MSTVPTVVTGQLVEEPSLTLRQRIKTVSFVYFANSAWIFILLSSTHASVHQWIHLAVSTLFLVFWLPVCGLQAARTPNSGKLALFTGVQGCLGFWNLLSLGSLIFSVFTLTLICEECAPVFRAGNETCYIEEPNATLIRSHEILDVPSRVCAENIPSMTTTVSGVLMLAMAVVSCSASIHGRKTGKTKIVHVVTTEPVVFHSSPMSATTPPIPGDL